MSASKIAKRYSKALVGLCSQDSSHEHVARDLKKVVDALGEHSDIEAALNDPKLGRSTKAQVLDSIGRVIGESVETVNIQAPELKISIEDKAK